MERAGSSALGVCVGFAWVRDLRVRFACAFCVCTLFGCAFWVCVLRFLGCAFCVCISRVRFGCAICVCDLGVRFGRVFRMCVFRVLRVRRVFVRLRFACVFYVCQPAPPPPLSRTAMPCIASYRNARSCLCPAYRRSYIPSLCAIAPSSWTMRGR